MEQSFFNPPSTGRLDRATSPRASRGIIVTAITLFALSGLLLGFTAGAITRPKQGQSSTPNNTNTHPVTIQTTTPQTTPTTATSQVKLGCPLVTVDNSKPQANNTVNYTFTVQAVDKSAGCLQSNPKLVQAPGITCKVWLIKASDDPRHLSTDRPFTTRLLDVQTLGQPLPHEINGLLFDPTTPQVQPCNDQGQGTWKYGIASSVDKGKYYLVALTDWQGKSFNWSWAGITVSKGDN